MRASAALIGEWTEGWDRPLEESRRQLRYAANDNFAWRRVAHENVAPLCAGNDNRMTTAGTGAVAYDPAGRLYRLGSGTETRFLYAGASIIAEYNQSNALQRRFVHGFGGGGLDEPLVWLEGTGTGNRKWHLADERGSVIAHANDFTDGRAVRALLLCIRTIGFSPPGCVAHRDFPQYEKSRLTP